MPTKSWWGRIAQYISNRDEGCSLGRHFRALGSHYDDHKILKALPWFKRLGRGYIALLGFVFFVDLLDLSAIDAQVPLGQEVASHPLEEALIPICVLSDMFEWPVTHKNAA